MNLEFILALLGTNALNTLLTGLLTRRVTKADATQKIADSFVKLVEKYEKRDGELTERVATLEKMVKAQQVTIDDLFDENRALRQENANLEEKITELLAWKNGVEESGEIEPS